MSTSCWHIVPICEGDHPDPRGKAREILDWFVARDLVEAEASDCTPSDAGHRFRPNIRTVLQSDHPLFEDWHGRIADSRTCGLEVTSGARQIFLSGGEPITMTCPACGREHDFAEATEALIAPWCSGEVDRPQCLGCGDRTHPSRWECEWGFGNLALSFWNIWPNFAETFLDDMRGLLGADIKLIGQRL